MTSGLPIADTIESETATGNVSWFFDDSPGCFPDCKGIDVSLPPSGPQPNPIPVTGTPGNAGTFSLLKSRFWESRPLDEKAASSSFTFDPERAIRESGAGAVRGAVPANQRQASTG